VVRVGVQAAAINADSRTDKQNRKIVRAMKPSD